MTQEQPPTPLDLEALKAAAEAATGGDWRAHITTKRSPEIYTNIPPPNTPNPLIAGTILRKADARFIALWNPETALRLLALIAEKDAALKPFASKELFDACEKRSRDSGSIFGDASCVSYPTTLGSLRDAQKAMALK